MDIDKIKQFKADELSITPHQDAARVAVADMRRSFKNKVVEPGAAGANARLRLALLEAYALALSRERDLGTMPVDYVVGVACGLSDVASSLIMSTCMGSTETDQVETLLIMMGDVATMAVASVAATHENVESGAVSGVRYDAPVVRKT